VLSPLFAYQTLERGDWSQAETLFQHLVQQPEPEVRGQGYAGLAAVAFARGDAQQAFDLAVQAEALDPEIVYSHVIRGHMLWDQGKLGAATAAYRTATEKPNGLPWQQAIAANRLGRLYAAEGFAGTALKYYDRAISQQPGMAVAYANKAHLLEQLGRPQEALGLYRQALQMAPEDRFTATLLRAAERRQHLAKDPQQQARLAQHVATLLQAHEAGKPPESPHDEWTSALLTLAFLHVQRPDSLALRAGEEEVLAHSLAHALRDSGRLHVIDQALLETLLVALQRHASDLADPQVALYVGRLLAARLLAMGRIGRSGTAETLSISLLEINTGAVQTRAEAPWTPDTLEDVVVPLSHALLAQVRQVYPLRGRILRINPQGVLLNIGSEHGVTSGLTMQVFGSETPSATESHVGLIEVTVVETQQSQARVLHHATAWQEGWRVQESRRE
jgi:tetratricopeptide (TPR) repeat protein